MNSKQIELDETIFNVVDEGAGTPILLVHGFPLDHTMWQFQIPALVDNGFRVVAPDLAGFGQSDPCATVFSMKSAADDLAEILAAVEITQPVVYCGLSMGGYIGWQFWQHHSERLSHLVACDTRAANDAEQVARGRRISAESVMSTGSRAVAETMIPKLFHQADDEAKRTIVTHTQDVISRTSRATIAAGQLAMANRPDATELLAGIQVPTLFVVGEHDEITTPDEVRENARLVAGSSFVQIPDAGHMAPLENPEYFNEELLKFLRS